jgi:uncharacterized protein YraI
MMRFPFFRFFFLLVLMSIAPTIAPARAAGDALTSGSGGDLWRQSGEAVFALPGTLRAAQGQPFSTFFIDRDGFFYALVGENAEVETQIVALREANSGVKVWGTLYPEGRLSAMPELVASAIQASDEAPPAVASSATAVVEVGRINVRAEPDVNAPPTGQLEPGTRCPIVERSADTKWYRLVCENGVSGWVSYQLVTVEGDPAGLTVAPTPTPVVLPTPTPPTFVNWKTAYFTNRDLAGNPVALDDLPDVRFDWGAGSPHPQVPPDNFSLRLERTIDFPAANYRFVARADDGVRVYLNGESIINDWQEGGARDLRADRYVAGPAHIMIEYFEAIGTAELHFGFAALREGEWEANYFNNPDLIGNPDWITVEPRDGSFPLDRNWGAGSPRQGVIGNDNFSARWEGAFFIAAGTYDFFVRSDDGVRVYLNGQPIINLWVDGYKEQTRRLSGLAEGYHDVRVEFYERAGAAQVRVLWQLVSTGGIQ